MTGSLLRASTMGAFVCASVLFAVGAPAQTVFYVDKANQGPVKDGASWATAFTAIQDGVEAARAAFGGEVWVAAGNYGEARPNAGSLRLRSGVDLYGGFAGGELARDQRDPAVNITIIDAGESNNGGPAASAVIGANDAILDGFVIRHGQGQDGAGMLNIDVSPTVINCVFRENVAQRFGGAVLNAEGATPLFRGCRFASNYAGNSGGAIANTNAAPAVEDCVFEQNDAGNVGGAIFNVEGGDVFLTRSVFDGNSALEGGGAIFNEGADPAITACEFYGNETPKFAGAIFNNNGASPLVVNCVFARNNADDRGGAITSLNSLFTAVNCTFAYNTSFNDGSVLFSNASGTTIFNSILWYNDDRPFFELDSVIDVRFSNVGGGQDGVGNIAIEPQFTDAENDDFSLKPSSPSINAGTTDGAPDEDLRGVERPQGDGIDQGAYEAEIVLPGPDTFACPITLATGAPRPPAPGTLAVFTALAAILVAPHARRRTGILPG